MPVAFVTAAALVNELMKARDEKRLLRLQRQLAKVSLLIIDELGCVPLSKTGRVSDLLRMSNLADASPTKEHDDNNDFQRTAGGVAERR